MPAWWSIAVYLLLPYAIAGLIWRSFRYAPYRYRWAERFGFVPPRPAGRLIWIHAVSVGEVRSAAPLIDAIADRLPRHQLLVTTMTPTGGEQVQDLFGARVRHAYLPYDFPDAVGRFLDRVSPELAIIAETEFWPNLFLACRQRRIPINLVNVRLSQTSFRGYGWVPRTAQAMFATADLICTQTALDAQRLRNLGVDSRKIHVTGNLKFDVPVPTSVFAEGRALRERLGAGRPVLIAGSTHPGEESLLLDAFVELRLRFPDLLLILVARHPERFGAVTRLSRRRGFRTLRRTELDSTLDARTQVVVGDTMGEMHRLYAAADLAFIGGSLVRHGGQNPLEACAVGVPVVFGPHMFNFEEITAMALERGAAKQIRDSDELVAAASLFFDHPDLRIAAGQAARSLIEQNHGSLANTMRVMERHALPAGESARDGDRLRAADAASR